MKTKIHELIEHLYRDHQDTLEFIGGVVTPHSAQIAKVFYDEMLAQPEAKTFIDHGLVQQRLHASMARWIGVLFDPSQFGKMEEYIAWQTEIGHVHARVKIPMHLIILGMRILKREINFRLADSSLDRAGLVKSLLLTGELIDYLIELINESYVRDTIENDRSVQALQMEMVNGNFALECQRLHLSLSEWLRETMFELYSNDISEFERIRKVTDSNFGLWVTHKMGLLFPNNVQVPKMLEMLAQIDGLISQAIQHRQAGNDSAFRKELITLNNLVNETGYLLGDIVEQTLSMESSRDPLTRVLNRRYLTVIMQRENDISATQNTKYAVLFVDLDHFKQVNDTYGHDTGDRVLSQVAEQIRDLVRPCDFIFRYGGEEFLVLLPNVTEQQALNAAERIRKSVEGKMLVLDSGIIKVTTSIGLSIYDGQTDYQQVIKLADDALYQAKNMGRNQVVRV
jgi:diguanylate cyclase